ncbi:hypothetical protein BDR06DRAFT_957992, partial [Suillus hirtellus]
MMPKLECGVDFTKLVASVHARSKARAIIRPPTIFQPARCSYQSWQRSKHAVVIPSLPTSRCFTPAHGIANIIVYDVHNAPSTRSVSPALTATTAATPPKSTTPSIPEDAPLASSEPLTQENFKELNQELKEKKVKGYKNIPSLDAITAHLAKARLLSVDGSARPPEAELLEDPKTPGATMKAPEHPLQFP